MSELHVDFVRERVHEIRSALFFNEGEAPFVFTATIISALDLDQEGYISFFIAKPDYLLVEEDLCFPARLDFFRKGKPFFLKVSGCASVISDEQEMDKYLRRYGLTRAQEKFPLNLVKLKVGHVEYYEPHRVSRDSLFMRLYRSFSAWLEQDEPDYRVSGALGLF